MLDSKRVLTELEHFAAYSFRRPRRIASRCRCRCPSADDVRMATIVRYAAAGEDPIVSRGRTGLSGAASRRPSDRAVLW